jgi:hypothetical protein
MERRKQTTPKKPRWNAPEAPLPWTLESPDPDRDLWERAPEFSVPGACPCCGGTVSVRDTPRWGLCIAEP